MSKVSSAIDSLATKIEGLDLSEEEVAVLNALLHAAGSESDAAPETEGFRAGAPLKFGLPDLRGRIDTALITWGGDVASLFPSRNVVINHEEQ